MVFNFPDPLYDGDVYWNGKLHGFAVHLQDDDKHRRQGNQLRQLDGDPVTIIDGGRVDYPALGWAEGGSTSRADPAGHVQHLLTFACGYDSPGDSPATPRQATTDQRVDTTKRRLATSSPASVHSHRR